MTTNYISWFNKMRMCMSVTGIVVNGILHKAHPIRECPNCGEIFGNGVCPKCGGTNTWRQTKCNKCGNPTNGFVFQSDTDKFCFFVFCQTCKKYEFVRHLPPKVERYSKKVEAPTPPTNIEEPPPLGSLTKTTKAAGKPRRTAKK